MIVKANQIYRLTKFRVPSWRPSYSRACSSNCRPQDEINAETCANVQIKLKQGLLVEDILALCEPVSRLPMRQHGKIMSRFFGQAEMVLLNTTPTNVEKLPLRDLGHIASSWARIERTSAPLFKGIRQRALPVIRNTTDGLNADGSKIESKKIESSGQKSNDQFSNEGWADIIFAFSKLRYEDSELVKIIAERYPRTDMRRMSGKEISLAAFAFGKIGPTPAKAFFDHICDVLRPPKPSHAEDYSNMSLDEYHAKQAAADWARGRLTFDTIGIRSLAPIVWSAAKTGYKGQELYNFAGKVLRDTSEAGWEGFPEWDSSHVSTILTGFANAGFWSGGHAVDSWEAGADLLIRRKFKDDLLCVRIAWAFSKAGIRHPHLLFNVCENVDPARLTPQGVANLAHSLAKLRYYKKCVFDSIADAFLSRPNIFKPQELASVIWSFSHLCLRDHKELIRVAGENAHQRVDQFRTEDLALVAFSFGHLETPHKHLFKSIAQRFMYLLNPKNEPREDHEERQKPDARALSHVLWAFAKTRLRHRTLMNYTAASLAVKITNANAQNVVSGISGQDIVQTVWAVGELTQGHHDPAIDDLLLKVADRVACREEIEFCPLELSLVAQCYANRYEVISERSSLPAE